MRLKEIDWIAEDKKQMLEFNASKKIKFRNQEVDMVCERLRVAEIFMKESLWRKEKV